MKRRFILLITLIACSFNLMAQRSTAVFKDTIMWKAAEFVGETGKFLNAKEGLAFAPKSAKLVKLSPAQVKKLQLPPPTKSGKGPIILKFGNKCYQFACGKGSGCDNCRMFWWDRNDDGKVQPRKELRCFCPEKRTKCRIRVRQVQCQ